MGNFNKIASNVNYDAGTPDRFFVTNFMMKSQEKTTLNQKLSNIYIPDSNINSFMIGLMGLGYTVKQFEWEVFAFSDDTLITFQKNSYGLHDCVVYYCDIDSFTRTKQWLNDKNDKTKRLQINWYYGNEYEEVFDVTDKVAYDSLYPFIEGGIESFTKKYIEAKENILILIGPPGTGKTTFIRHILQTIGKVVYLSYDMNVLSKDFVFSSFVADSDAGSFVIEDADILMKKRKDGNDNMSKLLNIGDGLITLNKKLIFSTNIENINDIDEAVTRPGRCYDIIRFRELTKEEANVVVWDYELPEITEKRNSFTLGEIFNRKREQIKPSFGFINRS